MKRLISIGIGIALLMSPLLASAQTVSASSNASLVAVLTQLVQVIEQELQQLFLAAHENSGSSDQISIATPSSSVSNSNQPSTTIGQSSLTSMPTSGVAPLTVTFLGTVQGIRAILDFGDGTKPLWDGIIDPIDCRGSCPSQITVNETHTYAQAGIYTATLKNSGNSIVGKAVITVANGI